MAGLVPLDLTSRGSTGEQAVAARLAELDDEHVVIALPVATPPMFVVLHPGGGFLGVACCAGMAEARGGRLLWQGIDDIFDAAQNQVAGLVAAARKAGLPAFAAYSTPVVVVLPDMRPEELGAGAAASPAVLTGPRLAGLPDLVRQAFAGGLLPVGWFAAAVRALSDPVTLQAAAPRSARRIEDPVFGAAFIGDANDVLAAEMAAASSSGLEVDADAVMALFAGGRDGSSFGTGFHPGGLRPLQAEEPRSAKWRRTRLINTHPAVLQARAAAETLLGTAFAVPAAALNNVIQRMDKGTTIDSVIAYVQYSPRQFGKPCSHPRSPDSDKLRQALVRVQNALAEARSHADKAVGDTR